MAAYDDIDFAPPAGVRAEAKRGLEWRDEYNRGGTAVGVARARDLSNGINISPDTARRMASYFARHEVDKQGKGFSPGEDGFPSAGRIAWALRSGAETLGKHGPANSLGRWMPQTAGAHTWTASDESHNCR